MRCGRAARTRRIRPSTIWRVSTSSTRAGGRPRSSSPPGCRPPCPPRCSTSAAAWAGRRGSSRPTRGLRVVGIDLTPEYVEVANELTRRCGLADRARFLTAERFEPAVRGRQLRRRLHPARGHEHRRQGRRSTPRRRGCCSRVRCWSSTTSCAAPAGRSSTRRHGRRTVRPASWSTSPSCGSCWTAAGFEVLEQRDRREDTVAWFEARAASAAAGTGRRR